MWRLWNYIHRVLGWNHILVPAPSAGSEQANGEFPYGLWEELTVEFIRLDGAVEYAIWQSNSNGRNKLNRFLESVAARSPVSHPQDFLDQGDQLRYWTYAYNAMVVRGVLEHYPIESVHAVKRGVELTKGLSFFTRLLFICGGQTFNLYQFEREHVLSQAKDVRLHFVLNCASGSCPIQFKGARAARPDFQEDLEGAARTYFSDSIHLSLDAANRTVILGAVIGMYEKDFIEAARNPAIFGIGADPRAGILDYVLRYASESLKEALKCAKDEDWSLEYRPFDWSLNEAESGQIVNGR